MKRFFAFILLCSLIYACKPGVPKELIQPEKMEKVLFDMHVAEGYISTITMPDSAKKVSASFYKGIYKKFEIDSAIYNRSLDYYYQHPSLMQTMYDHISNNLKKAKEEKQKPARPVKPQPQKAK